MASAIIFTGNRINDRSFRTETNPNFFFLFNKNTHDLTLFNRTKRGNELRCFRCWNIKFFKNIFRDNHFPRSIWKDFKMLQAHIHLTGQCFLRHHTSPEIIAGGRTYSESIHWHRQMFFQSCFGIGNDLYRQQFLHIRRRAASSLIFKPCSLPNW